MVQGVEHPPEKGKRLKELASKKIKDGMKADPLKSAPQIQEDLVNEMLESLGDQVEREEFIRSMPKETKLDVRRMFEDGTIDLPRLQRRRGRGQSPG